MSDKITDRGVSFISSLKNLESLTLASTSITPASIDYLLPLNELNMLVLKDIEFNDAFAEKVSKLKNLEIFTLNHSKIPDSNSLRFLANTKINSLILENINLDKILFKHILSIKTLKTLEINYCTFTKDAFEPMRQNETLTHLRIFNSENIHPENFEDLRKSKLQILNIKNCPVDDNWALRLGSIPTLKTLIFQMIDAEPSIKSEIEKTFEKHYHRKLEVRFN